MRFGLFGSAQAKRGGPDVDSAAGFREFVDNNVEAEALGYHSTFLVEHHFTGFGQVSATLNLLTWVGARTTTLRLGTAVMVLAWHNPVLLAEQAATLDLLSGGRLDFGIGKGYRYNEFAGFSMPMEEADGRFDESREVMLRGVDLGCAMVAPRQVLAVRRRGGRAACRPRSPTRPSGWARAARRRSRRWPRSATACCSTSSPPSRRSASGSRSSGRRSRRAVACSTR